MEYFNFDEISNVKLNLLNNIVIKRRKSTDSTNASKIDESPIKNFGENNHLQIAYNYFKDTIEYLNGILFKTNNYKYSKNFPNKVCLNLNKNKTFISSNLIFNFFMNNSLNSFVPEINIQANNYYKNNGKNNFNNEIKLDIQKNPNKKNKKFKKRKGDWNCRICHNINFAFRIECNKCRFPKTIFQ